MPLLLGAWDSRGKKVQGCLVAFGPVLPHDSISRVLLEIAHYLSEGIFSTTLDDDMDVVGHDDKGVQLEVLA